MPARKEIVQEAPCPNCNAIAPVIMRRRKPKQPWWELILRCDKCKGEWPFVTNDGAGPLIHDGNKRRIERHQKLMKQWENAKTPRERGKIMQKVQRMAEEEQEWIASL